MQQSFVFYKNTKAKKPHRCTGPKMVGFKQTDLDLNDGAFG